jgi:hypothetical protein
MAEASEHHQPGELPPIRDEAADTPLWLPVMGLCFLVVGAVALIWQSANGGEAESDEAAEVVAAEGEEAPAPAEAADGEPANGEPADEDPHAGHGH